MERRDVRRELARALPRMVDFDAFCLDCFPATFREMAPTLEQQARTTLLLSQHDPEVVLLALRTWRAEPTWKLATKSTQRRAGCGLPRLWWVALMGLFSASALCLWLWSGWRSPMPGGSIPGAAVSQPLLCPPSQPAVAAPASPAAQLSLAPIPPPVSAAAGECASGNRVWVQGPVRASGQTRLLIGNQNTNVEGVHGQPAR